MRQIKKAKCFSTLFKKIFRSFCLIIEGFRHFLVFFVILSFISNSFAEELDHFDFYKQKNFPAVVKALSKLKRPLTERERILEALAYDRMGDLTKKIESLRKGISEHPKKDILKRELAASLEAKADSYVNAKIYEKLKSKYQTEASKVLADLYLESSTPENFTALIQYYNRRKDYSEAIGLLEVYARKYPKGKVYYTYLCEAEFNQKRFSSALKSCGALTRFRPDLDKGHVLLSKVMEGLGQKQESSKHILKIASRFPASSSIQLELGKVLIEKGDNQLGLKHLEAHIKKGPSDEALVLKAETQFKLGNKKQALSTFVKACKQHKEPRKPLFRKIQFSIRNLGDELDLKKEYERELGKCRFAYRPKKSAPRTYNGKRSISSQ